MSSAALGFFMHARQPAGRLSLKESDVDHYHINVFWSEEDACWVADIPDLPHCSAFGAAPEEALHEVEIARKAWLDAARDSGRIVPEPRYRPLIYQIEDRLAG